MDPKKVLAIPDWPGPETVMDVCSFLGFTNHYHQFIHHYVQIARPLDILISGDNVNKKKKVVEWNEDCQTAFDKLKIPCTSMSVLAYAGYTKAFWLHTDASEHGLGALLYQKQMALIESLPL